MICDDFYENSLEADPVSMCDKEWGLKFPPERIQAMTEASKLKRLATVEDVAEQVLAYVKSKSVTGQNTVIDGGWGL